MRYSLDHISLFQKKDEPKRPLFKDLAILIIVLNAQCHVGSFGILSSYIDLATLAKLVFTVQFSCLNPLSLTTEMARLFDKMTSLRSLILSNLPITVEQMCEILPSNLRHLEISVQTVEEMKAALEGCRRLSSISFHCWNNLAVLSKELLEYLTLLCRDFTYQSKDTKLHLWLRKRSKRKNVTES